jgi:monofunctional biosynthetic peptidoglycan transglycosylase
MEDSAPSTAAIRTRRFRVAGMNCEGCAALVEQALLAVPGVENAIVDLDRAEAVLRADEAIADATLAAAVEDAGYTLLVHGDPQPDEPEPAPEPEPEPEPSPEPEPAPVPRIADDDIIVEEDEQRSWLATVWYIASRTVVFALAASLLLTIAYRFIPVPFTLLMIGESLFEGRTVYRTWVPLERISPNLVRAVIAAEDNEFCHHWGFDFAELRDAWRSSRNGGRLRGASTISQQTAKNVFLWTDRSWVRKGLEAYFTALIEALWPKRRIMEVYLNVIEWGPGIFGAEAAARHWFGKPASRLTQLEAARLAAILPSPTRWRANRSGPYITGRGYTIAARANNVDLNGDDRCAKP